MQSCLQCRRKAVCLGSVVGAYLFYRVCVRCYTAFYRVFPCCSPCFYGVLQCVTVFVSCFIEFFTLVYKLCTTKHQLRKKHKSAIHKYLEIDPNIANTWPRRAGPAPSGSGPDPRASGTRPRGQGPRHRAGRRVGWGVGVWPCIGHVWIYFLTLENVKS